MSQKCTASRANCGLICARSRRYAGGMSDSRYQCLHCGKKFELTESEAKRCPSCLRKTNIEKIGKATVSSSKTGPFMLIGALAVAAAGYFLWQTFGPVSVGSEKVPLAALDQRKLEAYLVRDGGKAEHAKFFAYDDVLSELKVNAPNAKEAAAEFKKSFDTFSKKKSTFWPLSSPLDRKIYTPAQVYDALKEDPATRVYPLEVALMGAAILRESGHTAMVAEVKDTPDLKVPRDGSGKLGYFVIAVYDAAPAMERPLL